jgi:hypothetical protein
MLPCWPWPAKSDLAMHTFRTRWIVDPFSPFVAEPRIAPCEPCLRCQWSSRGTLVEDGLQPPSAAQLIELSAPVGVCVAVHRSSQRDSSTNR